MYVIQSSNPSSISVWDNRLIKVGPATSAMLLSPAVQWMGHVNSISPGWLGWPVHAGQLISPRVPLWEGLTVYQVVLVCEERKREEGRKKEREREKDREKECICQCALKSCPTLTFSWLPSSLDEGPMFGIALQFKQNARCILGSASWELLVKAACIRLQNPSNVPEN